MGTIDTILPLFRRTRQGADSSGSTRPAAARHEAGGPQRPGLWARFCEVRRSRMALADLDDHLLRDIGVTRMQARAEAARWRWHRKW